MYMHTRVYTNSLFPTVFECLNDSENTGVYALYTCVYVYVHIYICVYVYVYIMYYMVNPNPNP